MTEIFKPVLLSLLVGAAMPGRAAEAGAAAMTADPSFDWRDEARAMITDPTANIASPRRWADRSRAMCGVSRRGRARAATG